MIKVNHIYSLDEIFAAVLPLLKKYHAERAILFGSYARGTATENSDVDLIIDTSGTEIKSLLGLAAVYCELEEALKKSIDLVTLSSLEQRSQMPSELSFRANLEKERVNIYDVA